MAWEGKKYKLEKSEKFDEYMMKLGIGYILRKMGNSLHPSVSLKKHGDEYIFETISTFKSSIMKFKPGEEFEFETLDGRKVMSTVTIDGNKMIQIEKGEKQTEIIREFSDKELIVTLKYGDVIAKRWYKAE